MGLLCLGLILLIFLGKASVSLVLEGIRDWWKGQESIGESVQFLACSLALCLIIGGVGYGFVLCWIDAQ